MNYYNETLNQFAEELRKLEGKAGIIHLQNDVDYKLKVGRFTGIEATEFYEDERDPMIFTISFINEAGHEDAIEIWDSAIVNLDFTQPDVEEEWMTEGLKFGFAALKDESTAIEFYWFA
jgi:hypothetical protein